MRQESQWDQEDGEKASVEEKLVKKEKESNWETWAQMLLFYGTYTLSSGVQFLACDMHPWIKVSDNISSSESKQRTDKEKS